MIPSILFDDDLPELNLVGDNLPTASTESLQVTRNEGVEEYMQPYIVPAWAGKPRTKCNLGSGSKLGEHW